MQQASERKMRRPLLPSLPLSPSLTSLAQLLSPCVCLGVCGCVVCVSSSHQHTHARPHTQTHTGGGEREYRATQVAQMRGDAAAERRARFLFSFDFSLFDSFVWSCVCAWCVWLVHRSRDGHRHDDASPSPPSCGRVHCTRLSRFLCFTAFIFPCVCVKCFGGGYNGCTHTHTQTHTRPHSLPDHPRLMWVLPSPSPPLSSGLLLSLCVCGGARHLSLAC